jgi:hypothetical protein
MKSTHFVAVLGLGMLYFGLSTAQAGATSDAQAALNKAYNDYYTALRAGPAKTPDQETQLRNQIIGPAQQALNKAMQQDVLAFDPNKAVTPGSNANPTSPSNSGRSSLGNQGGFRGNDNSGGATAPAPNPPATESAPIEGSAPKEIEFPGPYAPPKTTPSPTKSRTR